MQSLEVVACPEVVNEEGWEGRLEHATKKHKNVKKRLCTDGLTKRQRLPTRLIFDSKKLNLPNPQGWRKCTKKVSKTRKVDFSGPGHALRGLSGCWLLAGWLARLLAGWLLAGWLAGWLACWLADCWLTGWLAAGRLAGWLAGWLSGWLERISDNFRRIVVVFGSSLKKRSLKS